MSLRVLSRLGIPAMIVAALLTSCDNSAEVPEGLDSSSSIPSPVHSASPTLSPNSSPSPSPSSESSPSPSSESSTEPLEESAYLDVLRRNFTIVAELPEDGFSYNDFAVASKDEIILIGENEQGHSKVLRFNVHTAQFSDWLVSNSEFPLYNMKITSGQDGGPIAMAAWTYSNEEPHRRSVSATEDHVHEYLGIRETSPDNRRTAIYADGRGGIWGIDPDTGEEIQWTKGENDAQPLWLPDNSGVLFLKDTGEEIGDGAGPKYALARYDIKTAQTKVLPFEQGYWGRIEWLEPGKTLLAHNGFDDAIGLKLVDLTNPSEKQLVNTSDLSTRIASDPVDHRILVSAKGSFEFFSGAGEKLSSVPWPAGLDEFTAINPKYESSPENAGVPYYKSGLTGNFGVSDLIFQPNGEGISFLLGTIGSSTDDVVRGSKLYEAGLGGGEMRSLTKDYLPILHHAWTPSGDVIVALISPEERGGRSYLALKLLGISLQR